MIFRLLVSIEVNWLKMQTQIGILKRVAAAGQLSEQLQTMQSQVLSQLEGKLKTASLIVEQLIAEKREDAKARAKSDPKNGRWQHDDRGIKTKIEGFNSMRVKTKLRYVTKKKALQKSCGGDREVASEIRSDLDLDYAVVKQEH